VPRREFLYVDDLAEAAVFALRRYSSPDPLNVGSGEEITIADLAREIAAATGFAGTITFDKSKPDGVMRKVLDSGRILGAGWRPRTGLREGLRRTHEWFETHAAVRNAA